MGLGYYYEIEYLFNLSIGLLLIIIYLLISKYNINKRLKKLEINK